MGRSCAPDYATRSTAMISDVVWYAIILTASTTLSPLLLAYLTNRNHQRERREDWARQDAVARQVAAAAELLVANNAEIAAKAEKAVADLAHNTHVTELTHDAVGKLEKPFPIKNWSPAGSD
jgi:hypothetical protein